MIRTATLKTIRAPLLIAGLATLLFSSVAISGVAILEWFHGRSVALGEVVAEDHLAAAGAPASPLPVLVRAPLKPNCEECGVIDSTRRIATAGSAEVVYEITLRMSDGSTRVLTDARPATLHRGERIILISGLSAPVR